MREFRRASVHLAPSAVRLLGVSGNRASGKLAAVHIQGRQLEASRGCYLPSGRAKQERPSRERSAERSSSLEPDFRESAGDKPS